MEWINKVKNTGDTPDAHCAVKICWKRNPDPCSEHNACWINRCATKSCWSYS